MFWRKKSSASKSATARQESTLAERGGSAGLAIGLGTFGARFIAWMVGVQPALAPRVAAIDAERATDREEQEPWRISPGEVRDFRSLLKNTHLYPMMAQDPLLPTLTYPPSVGAGSGTSRLVGGSFKYPPVREQYRARIEACTHAALKNFKGRKLDVFHLQFALSSGGGTGSGMLVPAVLDAAAVVGQVIPGTPVEVTLHTANPSCFTAVVKDPVIRERLLMNSHAFYAEVAFAQDPNNLRALCDAMEIEPRFRPLVDEFFEYHGTDCANRSYLRPEESFSRIRANMLAINNTAIGSVHRDRDGCNDKLYLSSQSDGATRIVVSAASRIASVNVPAICDLFASVWTSRSVEALVAAPAEGNVRVLANKGVELLGIDTLKQDVLQSFRRLKEKLIAKQLPQDVRSMSRGAAEQTLRAAQGRFDGRVDEHIDLVHSKVLAFYAEQAIPKLASKVLAEVSSSAKSVGEVSACCKEIAKTLHHQWEDEERLSQSAAQEAHDLSGQANQALDGLPTRRFFRGSRKKFDTAEAVLAHQQAVLQAAFQSTWVTVLEHVEQAVRQRAEKVEKISHAIQEQLVALKQAAQQVKRTLLADSTSIISPDEVKLLPQKLFEAFQNGTGRPLPLLPLQTVVEAGASDLETVIQEFAETIRTTMERWLDADVPDVTTFAEAIELKFKMAPWLETALVELARSCPLEHAGVGMVRERILVVASGDELEEARKVVHRHRHFADGEVEVVAGSDQRTISVAKRISGMPLSSLPMCKDAERAARKLPPPGPGLPVYQVLYSSGYMRWAFGVPEDEDRRPDKPGSNGAIPVVPRPRRPKGPNRAVTP